MSGSRISRTDEVDADVLDLIAAMRTEKDCGVSLGIGQRSIRISFEDWEFILDAAEHVYKEGSDG